MARKKQKLINYHSPNVLSMHNEAGIASGLSYGEITVIHAPEQPLIGTKIDDDKVAWFMSSGQVETSIHNAISGATGDISQLKTDVRNLSSATDTYINTTAPNTYLTMQSAATTYYTSGDVETIYLAKSAASATYLTIASAASTYYTSGQVKTITDGLNSGITQNATDISELQDDVEELKEFSGKVETDYSTTAQMNSAIAAASAASVNSAKSYVDTVIADYATSANVVSAIEAETSRATGAEDALDTRIGSLETDMTSIKAQPSGLSATVIANKAKLDTLEATYETKDDANKKYTSAITYVNTASGNIETHLHEGYWDSATTQGKLDTIDQHIKDVSGAVISTSAAVKTLSGNVVNYVNLKVANVYRYKGSVTNYSELASITNKENGDVYNVVNANGTIGETGYTPAGTNYAWNETGNTWDALGGTIDLSAYATKEYVDNKTSGITNMETDISNLQRDLGALSGSVSGFSGQVVENYYTKSDTNNIFLSQSGAENTYLTMTSASSTYMPTTAIQETYWTSATTKNKLDTIDTTIQGLSASTIAIESAATESVKDLQMGTVSNANENHTQSGAKTSVTDRIATIDLSELIVDCGDY